MRNIVIFYASIICIFGAVLWVVLSQGVHLEAEKIQFGLSSGISPRADFKPLHFFSNLEVNARHPLAVLIMQILCIMTTTRVFGFLMGKVGQPSVIGEIIAGIVLGPSLVGAVFPVFSAFLFPPESLSKLHVLSQMGIILFMFIVGMELDIGVLKKKVREAVIISHTSIIFSYGFGVILAYFLYSQYAPDNVSFISFVLFMGIAMSITAFPVLARILQERHLTRTTLGAMIITCAAVDDITAWCLLAVVIAIINAGGMISAVGSIILTVVYVFIMWFVVRPIMDRLAGKFDTPESINKVIVAVIFGVLFLSSYITEIIGIHAFFGAFLAGVIMPSRKEFRHTLSEKIEDVSLVILLPLFFVFTGLRTQLGLLNQSHLWGVCLLIIGVAVMGKFVGSAVASKIVGQNWKDSLLIGVLMNTRGLMELVVLNIGYDLGILSTEIFTMMVIMALVTTFMTSPTINLVEYLLKTNEKVKFVKDGFQSLISFGPPKSGSRLLQIADFLNLKNEKNAGITMVHCSPGSDISMIEAEKNEHEAFAGVFQTARGLGLSLRALFRVTDNVEAEIVQIANENPYDIMLIGSSRELFTEDKTGGKVKGFIQRAHTAVGVFIDHGVEGMDRAAVVLNDARDEFLFQYIKRFLGRGQDNRLGLIGPMDKVLNEKLKKFIGLDAEHRIDFINELPTNPLIFKKRYDVVMISFGFWESLGRNQNSWLKRMPSVLIIRNQYLLEKG